ncbi:neurobeachin-like protein 1 isoform X3 [Mya arenaria]|uniref:neurobeachin-like protein 1 isoform X3 n=1 Tax=Mya arenaria TaxID=6604 RepID=UPI0022E07A54|nr:neurobeachin-like protein 1 isoform X3 [Mya arenaria]
MMDELNDSERLFELWMVYINKTDPQALREYIQLFTTTHNKLIDCDFAHLEEGFSEEGPHLNKLPDTFLQVLGNQLNQCCYGDDLENITLATNILKCLIVLCRNYDNVPLVASCEFVSYAVNIATVVVSKLKGIEEETTLSVYNGFLKVALHLLECLYDPYFTWRKRLLGWNADHSRLKFRPALIHVEVVPFVHECFQQRWLPSNIKWRLVHVFGAVISGSQHNALSAITPATLDVLLRVLGAIDDAKPTNEHREEAGQLSELILQCLVRMVHVIHSSSPDQRQVEVSQILEGYLQVLDTGHYVGSDTDQYLNMIGAFSSMLRCEDRSALQVIVVSGGTLDTLLTLLQKTHLCGTEAQKLAMSVVGVLGAILVGCSNATVRFVATIGYTKLLDVLKSLGQPSKELLQSLLNLVVEGSYKETFPKQVNNTQAAILLLQWLPDIQSHDLQIWLTSLLRQLCGLDHTNKMQCCKEGMISCLLTILAREKQISHTAVGNLIGLLECLGTQSITAIELKQLIGLLRMDEEGNQNSYCSRLMRAMSTMARREGKEGALHFFNLHEPTDGILLPGIRKWPGTAFSFHAWLCLSASVDRELQNIPAAQTYRRTLYSFLSNSGSGFEAFIKESGELTISVFSKKDHHSVTVPETGAILLDEHWHDVCIVHTNSKRPFVSSQLNVYVDGKLRLNSQLKYPNMTEQFTSCRVGAHVWNLQQSAEAEKAISPQPQKKISPFKFLTRGASKSNNSVPGVDCIPCGSEDDQYGIPIPLNGQIGSVCLFHEPVSATQVKCLYSAGPNNLTVFLEESDVLDLPGKMVLHYNARACKDCKIMDLSANQNEGILSGQKCINWDTKDVINCIGGIQVLFPLLEQVHRQSLPPLVKSPDLVLLDSTVDEQGDWVILPSSSYADTKLEQNQVAGFLTLLRNMVQTRPVNQQTFVQTNGAAVIGALLQKVNAKLIDVNVLMAVQLLIEATAATNKLMLQHLYQYILFDFRIWSRSDFPVRIGHIQYLSTIIKDDRRHFRKMFGVQYILDVIRTFYSTSGGLSEEDSRTIRVSLMGLVKYFILKDITAQEMAAVLNYMMACGDENMIIESLDMLIQLLSSGRKQDQLYLLMFEPNVGEMLYGLLTLKGFTIIYYEKIVKVLYILLKTDKVYEKNKSRLRLTDSGHLGLISLIDGIEISGPTIKRFLEQVSLTDTPQSYGAILAILQLIYNSGFDIKLEASRQLLSILVSKNGAAKYFAKQLGWQEVLTHLFILQPSEDCVDRQDGDITMDTEEKGAVNSDDLIDFGDDRSMTQGENFGDANVIENGEPLQSESASNSNEVSENTDTSQSALPTTGSVHSEKDCDTVDNKVCDIKFCQNSDIYSCDNVSGSKPSHPNTLNLSSITPAGGTNISSDLFNLADTPTTPMYIKSGYFEANLSEFDDDYREVSRSSSASAEDLSAIGQRTKERKQLEKEESCTSLSQISEISRSESDATLSEVEMRYGSMSASVSASHLSISERRPDSGERMLDSLGLKGSFLMNVMDDSQELCQNLLIAVFTVMWKGVEGSDTNAWKERCEVLSWLDHITMNNVLMCPSVEIKRRLLEMMLHACTSDVKDAGHTSQSYMENSIQLMKLVQHFLQQNINTEHVCSEGLLEDVVTLLDTLAVWDVQSGAGWSDMVHLGLGIIVAFTKLPSLDLCASATARLHTLVQTKLISSSAEAAFLIGHLNAVIVKAVDAGTDHYSFLAPVMKALIDKSYQLFNLDLNLPSLPSTNLSPTFFDDFKTYCKTEEWMRFIEDFVEPQKQHFTETVFLEMIQEMADFWSDCNSEMNMNLHKLNRERGESKLRFQDQILNVYQKKVETETKRFHNISTQLRNQHSSVLRQWRAKKAFFTGERGAWADRAQPVIHWKLSNQENFSRMKVKLVPNYNFDLHTQASLIRDNFGVEDINLLEAMRKLNVVKEAFVSKENIGDDGIGDEDWNVISAQSSGTDEYEDKEKLVMSEECELVTLQEVIKGRLEVTTTHVYFFDCTTTKEDGGEDFKWGLPQLREIHFRRYNLRRSGLEMFLVDQTNYFLNFQKKVRNKVYSRILSLRPPNLIYYGSRSPAELLKASGLTQKWVQREISNFEYLMQLNTIAGRTYNDLSQYPVFPWILSDYTSPTLDLEDSSVYRDLSKPIGVLNPRNEEDIREKYEHFEDPSGIIEKFHYGTHYSNAATVMHYMIRMEPFTTLHIALQSGKFDVSDRQFHSIPGAWKSMYNNSNDVKELIPEFFFLPEFLNNSNGFDLGKLQISNEQVNDVELPKWAESPEDFIYKHRKALESEYVSANLHNWIDLIFGYKQKGQAAIDALNVFYYCTYEGAVDLDAVKNPIERKALEGMINNFGQTPCQLLKDPHPKRLTFEEIVAKSFKTDRHLSIFFFLENLKVYFVEVSAETDPLVFINVPRSQPRSIIQHGMHDTMVTVSAEGVIGTHGWLPYDKSISNYFTFDKDPTVTNIKTRKKFNSPFAPGLTVSPGLFVVTHDCKLLISGGHWDSSIHIFHIGKARKLTHICRHIDIVTCLALDYCGSHLITGSRDTTCVIWQVLQQGGVCAGVSPKPLQTLYGHDHEVTAVHISSELDMAVSASKDGTVMVHTVRKGHYMRTLRPETSPGYNLNIPMIAVDEMGHIVIYCHESQPVQSKTVTTLYLFSLNGKLIISREVDHGLGHMIIKGENLITGDSEGNIIVYEIFGLRQMTCLPLYVPIHSLAITNSCTQLMAGLRDGKLIIIGRKANNEVR